MTIPAFPLQWPAGWRRTPAGGRSTARFAKKERKHNSWTDTSGKVHQSSHVASKELSIADGVERVRTELQRMGIRDDDLVISSNLELRLDGLPRSGQREPADPGIAVYWRDRGETRCMAIDRYDRVADNLGAVAATLEAMRAIERHGGAEILNRAFAGFAALPSPTSARPWREVLGFAAGDTVTSAEVERAFKETIKGKHPDQGGNEDEFRALVAARDAARLELCYETDQSNWGG